MKKRRKPEKYLALMLAFAILLVLGKAWGEDGFLRMRTAAGKKAEAAAAMIIECFFQHIWNQFYPVPAWEGPGRQGEFCVDGMSQERTEEGGNPDPAYRAVKAEETFWAEHPYLMLYGNEETALALGAEDAKMDGAGRGTGGAAQAAGAGGAAGAAEAGGAAGAAPGMPGPENAAVVARNETSLLPGRIYQLAQLEDYDFLMSHFYNVHTSTTAGRELMDAKKLLSRDFRLAPERSAGTADQSTGAPQILIYHTHSQEAFADSCEGENIVAAGAYLAELLQKNGFSVYHDRSVYDVRDGKLDRNKAYTYALEGITKILEEHPSIQVVIDLHRDGVKEGTHLVTEVNGKPTARIMFFNGLSQTPDGPIPYLENPFREDNLAFSLQLQLKAAAHFPDYTRKIYLKGLRYNQHLRPASCLVEAGAQTNTYEEVRNAMEPLAEVFTMLLQGK